MSTILKALRRLEADERRKSEAQDLTSETPLSASPRRFSPGPWVWLFGVLAVLMGAGMGVGLRVWWVDEVPASSVPLAESRMVLPAAEEALAAVPSERVVEVAGVEETLRTDPDSIPHVVSRPLDRNVLPRTPARVSPADVSAPEAEADGRIQGVTARSIADTSPAPAMAPPPVETPVASGPSRPVEAFPLATGTALPTKESDAKPPPAKEAVAPVLPAREPQPKPTSRPPPEPKAEVKLAVQTPAAVATPEKAMASPPSTKALSKAIPAASKATPPPVSAAAAATVPASLDVTILSTTWHPHREKRSALLSSRERTSQGNFAEGDLWMGWKVVEIKLSSVSFERQGVRVERKVGQAP